MRKFADLQPSHPPPPQWQAQRDRIAQLADGFDTGAIIPRILPAVAAAYEAGENLPTVEDLRGAEGVLPDDLREVPAASYNEQIAEGIVKRILNMALARFIAAAPADFKRVSAVAKLENDVEWRYLPEVFARELKTPADWAAHVLGLSFEFVANESEDQKELLNEEIAKWDEGRTRQVPRWRQGNISHLGLGDLLLTSALLQAVSEREWLKFLDQQALPGAVETLLWQADLGREPTRVLPLIEQSPAAFDDAGVRTRSVAVYFLIEKALGFIEQDLDRRVRRDMTEEENSKELALQEGLLEELVDSIAARVDAPTLLVELGAEYMRRAQESVPDSTSMKNRLALSRQFAIALAKKIGDAPSVLAAAEARVAVPHSTPWGLWLLGAAAASASEEPELDATLRPLSGRLWTWLKSLMIGGDSSLVDRYSGFPEWVVHLAGLTLSKLASPVSEFGAAWGSLAAQRLEPVENRYSRDTWRVSKFLCRAGVMAARVVRPSDEALSGRLWTESSKMAISAWLASWNDNAISEVIYALSHLGAGSISVAGEPSRTLAYLRGEPELFARAAASLLGNGMTAAEITDAGTAAGVNVLEHLELARNGDQIVRFEEVLAEFRKADRPAPATSPPA